MNECTSHAMCLSLSQCMRIKKMRRTHLFSLEMPTTNYQQGSNKAFFWVGLSFVPIHCSIFFSLTPHFFPNSFVLFLYY
jgi:hypothetical protein